MECQYLSPGEENKRVTSGHVHLVCSAPNGRQPQTGLCVWAGGTASPRGPCGGGTSENMF